MTPTATSAAVRERLEEALRLNLIGPGPDHPLAREELPGWVRPLNWYLTGFLVPKGAKAEDRAEDDSDDDPGAAEVPDRAGLPEESSEDWKAAKRGFFPSSIGLSFLVAPTASELRVAVTWGEYEKTQSAEAKDRDGKPRSVWRRTPRREDVRLALGKEGESETPVPDSGGLVIHALERGFDSPGSGADAMPRGTRAVSLFLVNERPVPAEGARRDSGDVFQAAFRVACDEPFVGRSDPSTAGGWEARVAALHYADAHEFATGHGVSADWELDSGGACREVWTTWIPRTEVPPMRPRDVPGADLSMNALGSVPDGAAAREKLFPLVEQYRRWIASERRKNEASASAGRDTAEQLLHHAGLAADRIEAGIELLAQDDDVLDAFRMANRAVAKALSRRIEVSDPKWRPFQIAFLLLNLPGLAKPEDPRRDVADLLFFPTGGGKTEAYLGLAAFAMVLRRLRHPEAEGRAGAGVSVIMRYTLRLLTFDQLDRAASLVCALELERESNPARYGAWRFEIGLWVGQAATPNRLGHKGDKAPGTARRWVLKHQQGSGKGRSPIPLTACPWCRQELEPDSFSLEPDAHHPTNLSIVCLRPGCEFSGDRPLPIVAVDEPLYRRLPAFLIATVDKFASLPWVGASGALLGGATHWDGAGFYGAAEGESRGRERLPAPLPPPDLIVQDELHLISGPLGTMTGLYETAIDALASRPVGEATVRPKLVASTATAHRAGEQVQALFGRPQTAVFPPPGPDRRDSFFASTPSGTEVLARRYLGIAAPGRNPRMVVRRVLVTLAAAGWKAFREHRTADENPADPYLTILCYFNALRELGGGRRIIEEEVQNTAAGYGSRKRINEEQGLFADWKGPDEVMELTSRVSTEKVAEARKRLNHPFGKEPRNAVSWAIATNMISVGLDIPRLGLLVVVGQPKTHSEYIQATSRVGRDAKRPGLVVTLLNVHKPRDRSHYERFRHYHETFYRSVEGASVTPFSARAMDRGFAGAMVALARHVEPSLTPAASAGHIEAVRDGLEDSIRAAFVDRLDDQRIDDSEDLEARERSVQARTQELLDAWIRVAREHAQDGVALGYQRHEPKAPSGQPLLRDLLDEPGDDRARFRIGRSLRDVEPGVRLLLEDSARGDRGKLR